MGGYKNIFERANDFFDRNRRTFFLLFYIVAFASLLILAVEKKHQEKMIAEPIVSDVPEMQVEMPASVASDNKVDKQVVTPEQKVKKSDKGIVIQDECPTTEIVKNGTASEAIEQKATIKQEEPSRSVGRTTSEILEEKIHAQTVEQAKRYGVSTEGSTSEILDRITHAQTVEQAKRYGVSTEGSTSEILDRIIAAQLENL